jgi:DNA-binding MarR family transcriptional regulator
VDVRRTFDDLLRLETLIWARIDSRLRHECDITLGSFDVMLILERVPRCRVQDIAEALSITVGGASQAVDRLERKGWCRRTANPEDRRSSLIELTPDGWKVFRPAAARFDEELVTLLERPLSADTAESFGSVLALLRSLISVPDIGTPRTTAGEAEDGESETDVARP